MPQSDRVYRRSIPKIASIKGITPVTESRDASFSEAISLRPGGPYKHQEEYGCRDGALGFGALARLESRPVGDLTSKRCETDTGNRLLLNRPCKECRPVWDARADDRSQTRFPIIV
jgi:hypothetical protein